LIQEQVEAGLYSLKRYGYYLQKIYSAWKPALKDMLKDTEHENEKKQRIEKDRMSNHVQAYRRMQDIHNDMLLNDQKFASDVLEFVAEPLLAWHKQAEKRREALLKKEEKLMKEQKELNAKVVSSRNNAHKQWLSLQQKKRTCVQAEIYRDSKKNGVKDLQNAEKDLEKERQKTEQVFRQHEELVAQANEVQQRFWTQDLPALVREWEVLEFERLTTLGKHMTIYAALQRRRVAPLEGFVKRLEESADCLDANAEMREYVQTMLRHHNHPTAPSMLMDGLPCAASQLTGDVEDATLATLLNMDMNAAVQKRVEALNASPAHQAAVARYNQLMNAGAACSLGSLESKSPESPAAAASPEAPATVSPICYMQAMYPFSSTDPNDLNFNAGDIIAVLEQPGAAEGDESGASWWIGCKVLPDRTLSPSGAFPSNYVKALEE